MHYSGHRQTASVAYVTTLTYASTDDQLARPAFPSIRSSNTKLCQSSSVRLSYVALYAPLDRSIYRDLGETFKLSFNSKTTP